MSENRVLRRIFGPKREELTESLRKLRNEELRNFCFASDIIRMIKSKRMKRSGNGEMRNACKSLVGRAMAQAVSRRPLTAAARVRAQVNPMGFVVDKVALGQVFLRDLRFSPC
jgi:hypothetical protein